MIKTMTRAAVAVVFLELFLLSSVPLFAQDTPVARRELRSQRTKRRRLP